MGLCIFDIDDLSFCLKFPVLQDERHVAYRVSLSMSVMPIRSPLSQVVPLARVFTLIPPVNCTATLPFAVVGAVSSVLH